MDRVVVEGDLTLGIDEVLGEVPGDLRVCLVLQELEEVVSVVTYAVALFEHGELNAVRFSHPVENLSVRVRLLPSELVAGEGENLKAALAVGTVHIDILSVVPVCILSLARDIDDDGGLGTCRPVSHRFRSSLSELLRHEAEEGRSHVCFLR